MDNNILSKGRNIELHRRISMSKDTKSLFCFLQRYEDDVKFLSAVHYKTHIFYKYLHYLFNYPPLVISIFINSALFSKYFNIENNLEMYIIGNGITIFCNLLVGIQNLLKFENNASSHLHYSKEYSRIFRNICRFYENNIIYQNQRRLDKKILVEFLRGVQSNLYLLLEDAPRLPSFIVARVKGQNIDLLFYVANTSKLKNKYTYSQMMEIKKINNIALKKIIEYIQINPEIHKKYPGFYRNTSFNLNLRKDLLNFLILEKNISFDDIIHCYNNIVDTFDIFLDTSIENLQIIEYEESNHFVILTIPNSESSDSSSSVDSFE
jgi:hypothetical protein